MTVTAQNNAALRQTVVWILTPPGDLSGIDLPVKVKSQRTILWLLYLSKY
jgi:hypothetical protein